MRTIKFRGKDCQNEWVYGDLIHKRHDPDTPMIQDLRGLGSDVNPVTVGQFTGLLDKNGTEIYEGDILKHDDKDIFRNVYWDNNRGAYFTQHSLGFVVPLCHLKLNLTEVVGNLFDDKELKGGTL